jgi:ABC transporter transmembrane region 2/ABC transporter
LWPPWWSALENKNQAEAEYRYVLTRLRENGESIAVLGGEEEERNTVDGSLTNVLRRWRQICFQTVRTTIISQTSGYIALVLPIILCAPKFLNGTMTLGQVMQAASAFTIVQAAFNWLVDNYPRLADWTASARRVASLRVSLDALERAEKGEGVNRIERTEGTAASLRLSDLSVTLDTGKAVVKDAEVDIMPGERVLVAGESGTGKSTLVRAISGLWPWGAMARTTATNSTTSSRRSPPSYLATKDCGLLSRSSSFCCVRPGFSRACNINLHEPAGTATDSFTFPVLPFRMKVGLSASQLFVRHTGGDCRFHAANLFESPRFDEVLLLFPMCSAPQLVEFPSLYAHYRERSGN